MLALRFCIPIALFFTAIAHGRKHSFDMNDIQTLFSFGDSYTTQNLDLSTMKYACQNCTSSGGMNWVEYLTNLHPMTYWDLAYNSAPVSNLLVGQETSKVTDLTTQITKLFPQHFSKNVSDPSKTLYTTWVGINDIDLTWNWTNTRQLDATLMLQYEYLVDYLSRHGAQYIVIMNVPPIHRAPMWSSQPTATSERIRRRVQDFNRKLYKLACNLNRARSHGKVMYFEAWSVFSTILDNPQKYNLTNVVDHCRGGCPSSTSEQYFWYNDLHPTYKIHQYLAEAFYKWLRDQ